MLINITLGGEYVKKSAKGEIMPWRPDMPRK
jgi:hypothetical protein